MKNRNQSRSPKNKKSAKSKSLFKVNRHAPASASRGHKQGQGSGHGPNRGAAGGGRPGGRGPTRGRSQKSFLPPAKKGIGRIQKNQRGFAFIIPQEGGADIYVARAEARSVMQGDLVEFRVHRSGRFLEAEITRVVEHACTQVLGRIEGTKRGAIVQTDEGEIFTLRNCPPNLLNQWAIAKIEVYPTPDKMGSASVKTVIGKELEPRHDNAIAIARYGIREGFSREVIDTAHTSIEAAKKEMAHPSEGRKDLRALPFVTIDGEDAKDFDDAVLVETRTGKTGFVLYVAIADVSFFVRTGSALDLEARERSTSVYLPGTCVPMLPEELSNDLCSLNPQTDKLTLVAEMHMDGSGNVVESKFYEAIIRTAARLTYTQVHAFFGGDKTAIPEICQKPLTNAHGLYEKMLKLRAARGVLDFQLPEGRFELDKEGRPIRAFAAPTWDSHKLIEEFMICANSAVAKALRGSGNPALYRVHETPDFEKLEALNRLIRSLGFSHVLKEASPKAFSALLAMTTGKKGASTLHKGILRSQKQARYEPNPKGHFGLALLDYTHFTSPIRRYPDLVVHRALKHFILGRKHADKNHENLDFTAVGQLTSERERRAMEAERFSVRRKQCWFMKERIGEVYEGTVGGVIAKGLFLEIPEFAIEGFLPVDSLLHPHEFDEARTCFRRRPGHTTLGIGDKLTFQVEHVSVEDGEITLIQVE